MALGSLRKVFSQAMLGLRGSGPQSDGDLVERFVQQQDQSAFEELLLRHGPMVLQVCRRILGNAQDAEDAFQATFILLARKARGLSQRESVGAWLHGVAYRVALKARATAARRHSREKPGPVADQSAVAPALGDDAGQRDLRRVLDEELDLLPEKYRAPVVLCYLEGKTTDEAAQSLGWPRGTVATQLSRARDRLRERLARRGVTLSATALASLLGQEMAAAAIPEAMGIAALKGANSGAAISPPVAALVDAMLRSMAWAKAKWWLTAAVVLLLVGSTIALTAGKGNQPPPAPEPVKAADPFRTVWRFDRDPGADFRVVSGRWMHDPRPPGTMVAPRVAVVLPGQAPAGPAALTIQVRKNIAAGYSQAGACWTDGRRTLPRKFWHKAILGDPQGVELRFVFADRWMFHYVGDKLHRVHEYEEPYPANQIMFQLANLIIEEIALDRLKPEELPLDLKDPVAALKKHGLHPGRADPEEFPSK